jgi:hypothetical protein
MGVLILAVLLLVVAPAIILVIARLASRLFADRDR